MNYGKKIIRKEDFALQVENSRFCAEELRDFGSKYENEEIVNFRREDFMMTARMKEVKDSVKKDGVVTFVPNCDYFIAPLKNKMMFGFMRGHEVEGDFGRLAQILNRNIKQDSGL